MDLDEAQKDKATNEHNVIDDAILAQGNGYTVFSIVNTSFFFHPELHANILLACWGTLPALREEIEERGSKGLYGQGKANCC